MSSPFDGYHLALIVGRHGWIVSRNPHQEFIEVQCTKWVTLRDGGADLLAGVSIGKHSEEEAYREAILEALEQTPWGGWENVVS